MSASRVMATCALLGQAVGTASAIAIKNGVTPREILKNIFASCNKCLWMMIVGCLTAKQRFQNLRKVQQLPSTGEDAELLFKRALKDITVMIKISWSGKIGDTVTFSFDSEKGNK